MPSALPRGRVEWLSLAASLTAAVVALGVAYGAGLSYWPRLGVAIMAAWAAGRLVDLVRRGRHSRKD